LSEPYPLALVTRSDKTESIHYGHAVVLSNQGIKKHYGDPDFCCYTRSIIKPIQAKISYEFLGHNLDPVFLALACASHNSEPDQLNYLEKFSEQFNINKTCLQCGFDPKYPNSTLHHNCAGKHLAMLSACKNSKLDLDTYLSPEHPLQKAIYQELLKLGGSKLQAPIHTGIDGCSLPTFYMSLKNMAEIFLAMIQNPDYIPIINAMNSYPDLVGGKKQIDSIIMKNSPNKFIAKGGAEGLMMIANLKDQEVLIIKIIDGSSRAKAYISSKLISELGWLDLPVENNIYNARGLLIGSFF
jgi:L-asparaginase II